MTDLDLRFDYHPPLSQHRVEDHETVRQAAKRMAHELDLLLPEGREKSLALTKIEEAMLWGNAALARADDPYAVTTPENAASGPRR